mmetsp:Transcript_7546/g.27558  ORF Transcript_7546/g.27558 Transcript_7546/m.27558 type:complete len:406 (+) Transcript_7546:1134-2351(+)
MNSLSRAYDPPRFFALSAFLELTGSTAGSETPSKRVAFSLTNFITSSTSLSLSSKSVLFTTNTTFFPHLRMYVKNFTSLSVIGRSAESTNKTKSARGTNSSVNRCCRCKITFVPGVSTMRTCCNNSAGISMLKNPSSVCSRPFLFPYLNTEISFVVGKIPSATNLSPSIALMRDDLPALNSPTMTKRNNSSSPLRASTRSLISSKSWQFSCKNANTSSINRRSRSIISSPASLTRLNFFGVAVISPAAPVESTFTLSSCSNASKTSATPALIDATSFKDSPSRRVTPFARLSARNETADSSDTSSTVESTNIGTLTVSRIASRTAMSRTRSRSAPSFDAVCASSALTHETTTKDVSGRDFRATTVGTPSSLKTTPSSSALVAMSVLSHAKTAARERTSVFNAVAA